MNQKQEDFAQWLTERMGDDWRDIVCGLTARHYTDTTDIPNLGDERCQWLVLGWLVAEHLKHARFVIPWFYVDGKCDIEVSGVGCAPGDEITERNTIEYQGDTFLDAIEAAARALPGDDSTKRQLESDMSETIKDKVERKLARESILRARSQDVFGDIISACDAIREHAEACKGSAHMAIYLEANCFRTLRIHKKVELIEHALRVFDDLAREVESDDQAANVAREGE